MSDTPQSASRRLNIIAVILLIIVVAVIIVVTRNRPEKNLGTPPSDAAVANIASTTTAVTYKGVDGKNAYDLLKENYTVVADQTAYGPMVKSINGEAATDSTYWSFKVNGEIATVGADQYVTKSTDTITWELTKIE